MSMGAMARSSSLHICDGCDATVTSTENELTQVWGWVIKRGGTGEKKWSLTLCDECKR